MGVSVNPCRGCGADAGPDVPQPNRCGQCPPNPCPDCGEPDNAPCACYVSLDGMAMADIKGLLARADLSAAPTNQEDA